MTLVELSPSLTGIFTVKRPENFCWLRTVTSTAGFVTNSHRGCPGQQSSWTFVFPSDEHLTSIPSSSNVSHRYAKLLSNTDCSSKGEVSASALLIPVFVTNSFRVATNGITFFMNFFT